MINLLIILLQLNLTWQVPCNHSGSVRLDDFNNSYVFSENTITKFNKSGESVFTYSSLSNGEISSIDVSNPLRILVHFRDNNEVLFLDNTLSEQKTEVNLNDLDYYDVSLVSSSFDNHLWVYRSATQTLVRLSNLGELKNESVNLSTVLSDGFEEEFVQLNEVSGTLYLVSEFGLVMVFDQYGGFLKKFKLEFKGHLNFLKNSILFEHQKKIHQHFIDLNLTQELYSIPESVTAESISDFKTGVYVDLVGSQLRHFTAAENPKK